MPTNQMPFTHQNIPHLTLEALQRMPNHIDNPVYTRTLRAFADQGTHIRIVVPVKAIQAVGRAYELVLGEVVLEKEGYDGYKVVIPCFVASGRWKELRNIATSEIDIVKHFDQLLPKSNGIGLYTYMNGIQNNPKNFREVCEKIISKIEGKTLPGEKPFSPEENPFVGDKSLFIGLYNATNGLKGGIGFLQDFSRMSDEWVSNPRSILSLRQMFATFGSILPEIRPRLRWVHIAHSEGGLLANRCFTSQGWGLTNNQKNEVKKLLITSIYGGVDSVSNDFVCQAFNTYSTKDIAFHFACPYLDKLPRPNATYDDRELLENAKHAVRSGLFPNKTSQQIVEELKRGEDLLYIKEYPYECTKKGRTITVVKCISENISLIKGGDHGFANDTYQLALEKNLYDLRNKWEVSR